LGAQRPQVFATDEVTVGEQRKPDEQVGGQVGQFAVAAGVVLPAPADTLLVVVHLPLPAVEVRRQRDLPLGVRRERPREVGGIVFAAGFELVDLAAQAGPAAIDAPGVEEHRSAHLGYFLPGLFSTTEAVKSRRTREEEPSTRR